MSEGLWHFQIMRHKLQRDEHDDEDEYEYQMHEYYQFEDGTASWTQNPVAPSGVCVEDLIDELDAMLDAATRYGVRDHSTGEIVED